MERFHRGRSILSTAPARDHFCGISPLRIRRRALGWAAAILAPAACLAQAPEKWADPALPLRDGLELWLDASRLNAARLSESAPPLRNDEAVVVWQDASGRQRNLLQSETGAEPSYQADLLEGQPLAALRFDGVGDHLDVTGLGASLAGLTLFLVAAPHSNQGGFSAFLSLNASRQNDYQSGLNLDQGHEGRSLFDRVNIEGRGSSGQQNLLLGSHGFGAFHVLTVVSTPGGSTRLFAGGTPQGSRPRAAGSLNLDELRLGARYYSNTREPPRCSGFFNGDIAEVILYGRALADAERSRVEAYLEKKHEKFLKLPGLPAKLAVRMLAPGFTVRELPVSLPNVNGLLYAPGGRLLALGYDGMINALSDTDGDGLEDRVEAFWDRPTLRIPIAMALRPEGLYVTSHGKVSLLRDLDGDGKPDAEEVVAEGWEQPDVATGGGVDAMGIALDREGNIFFGLGCSDFTNAYRLRDGKPRYDPANERGTILRISPDRKRREIVCTGIRFPFALKFNRRGDLFATDQEGETWLPGGNPLDELDHILPGRHYGFPPRHPQYLPDVVDEPAVVSFSPQHQSTCGLVFNEAGEGRKSFGPPSWEGDALAAGYSRGKLWRVRLAKTPAGYVGRPAVLAAAGMLTLELAISPAGDLVLACHSGAPDWGSGPNGMGKLFKVSYTGRGAPQPLLAWAAGPMETRVAWDRPLDGGLVRALAASAIRYGDPLRPGDRHEVHRPGYVSVQAQMAAQRGALPVSAARLEDGGRTLVLATDPHPFRTAYALTIPVPEADVELAYDLSGVEARWEPAGAGEPWSGWLPHLDLEACRAHTAGSAEHERLRDLLGKPGRLHLKTRIEVPEGEAVLTFASSSELELERGEGVQATAARPDPRRATLALRSRGEAVPVSVHLQTGAKKEPPWLHVSFHAAGDPTERPLALERLLLPWAPARIPPPPAPAGPPPELAGGDWARGEAVFSSPEAKCSLCHAVRGKGGKVGPDLSNLVYRDAASVLRDIVEPSASINPDYVPFTVVLRDKQVLAGLVRGEGADRVRLLDTGAKEIVLARSDICEIQASSVSIMPQGIQDAIGRGKVLDLLAFLTAPPPHADPPPPGAPVRTRADVEAALGAPEPPGDGKLRPLNIVLVAGPKDHGPGEHDYPAWQRRWKELFGRAGGVRLSLAWGWPDRGQWDLADLVVLYFWNHDWGAERYRELDAYLARGGGLVALHSAVIPDREPLALAGRLGLAWEPSKTKFRHGPLDLKMTGRSPLTAGLGTVHFVDETYWPLVGEASRVEVLATAEEEGAPRPIIWTREQGKGRVFATVLGHYSNTFDDPLFRILILRGMAWAAGEPPGRFRGLVMDGATMGAGR